MFRLIALLSLAIGLWVAPATATGGVIGALNTNTTEEPAPEPRPTPGLPMPPQGQYQSLPIMIDCGRYEDVISIILKAGEQPFAAGKILFKIPDGRAIEAILEMETNTIMETDYPMIDEWWNLNIEYTNEDVQLISTNLWNIFKQHNKILIKIYIRYQNFYKFYCRKNILINTYRPIVCILSFKIIIWYYYILIFLKYFSKIINIWSTVTSANINI